MSATDAFYFVLIKDRAAKVINENDIRGIRDLEFDGWKIVWDSAKTEADGFAYAARQHRCLNPEYSDTFGPTLMAEPKSLYRSVSVAELRDILETDVIRGKGNLFNEYDDRRFVFFGDQISKDLISQGEDIYRQAYVALLNEPIFAQFEQVAIAHKKACSEFYSGFLDRLKKMNLQRFTENLPPIYVDPENVAKMPNGDSTLANRLMNQSRISDPQLTRIANELKVIESKMAEMREAYNKMEKAWVASETERRDAFQFTSAIIQTVPLRHGYRYTASSGKTGMSSDEYGFYSGSVSLEDVVRIHLVNDRTVVRKVEPKDFEALRDEVTAMLEPQQSLGMSF